MKKDALALCDHLMETQATSNHLARALGVYPLSADRVRLERRLIHIQQECRSAQADLRAITEIRKAA